MLKKTLWVTAAILVAASFLMAQTDKKDDPWIPLRYFVGQWRGTSSGEPGNGTAERKYEFALRGRYLRVSNKSVYPPQEKNKNGETHEDAGYFSYDKARKTFMLRQFHVEGFVNTYAQQVGPDLKQLVFVSEAIENIPAGWRARETYSIISEDEFVERFDLAEPGKDFQTYVESRFRRVRE